MTIEKPIRILVPRKRMIHFKPLNLTDTKPAVIVHPYCFHEGVAYDDALRERLPTTITEEPYIQDMETLIANYQGPLFLLERPESTRQLTLFIKKTKRKGDFHIFSVSDKDLLDKTNRDIQSFLSSLAKTNQREINVAGCYLEIKRNQDDKSKSYDRADITACVGRTTGILIENNYSLSIISGLTLNHMDGFAYHLAVNQIKRGETTCSVSHRSASLLLNLLQK